jgi:hypothetical protein
MEHDGVVPESIVTLGCSSSPLVVRRSRSGGGRPRAIDAKKTAAVATARVDAD